MARQEIPLVTSDDALQNLPPGIDNESSYVLADEVRSLNFQYFDGTDWQDSWDSTALGADGVTPVGSPRAIAVTIGIAPSRGPGTSQDRRRQLEDVSPRPRHPVRQRDHGDEPEHDRNDGDGYDRNGHDGERRTTP